MSNANIERRSTMADFIITAALGKGSFGSVSKVKRKQDGQLYVLYTRINERNLTRTITITLPFITFS